MGNVARAHASHHQSFLKCFVTIYGKFVNCCLQVELHYTSLNKGDVFILDEGMTIHCWNGLQCSRTERMKVC